MELSVHHSPSTLRARPSSHAAKSMMLPCTPLALAPSAREAAYRGLAAPTSKLNARRARDDDEHQASAIVYESPASRMARMRLQRMIERRHLHAQWLDLADKWTGSENTETRGAPLPSMLGYPRPPLSSKERLAALRREHAQACAALSAAVPGSVVHGWVECQMAKAARLLNEAEMTSFIGSAPPIGTFSTLAGEAELMGAGPDGDDWQQRCWLAAPSPDVMEYDREIAPLSKAATRAAEDVLGGTRALIRLPTGARVIGLNQQHQCAPIVQPIPVRLKSVHTDKCASPRPTGG
jgi:hypothetical protein